MDIRKRRPTPAKMEADLGQGDVQFHTEEKSRIWRPNGALKLELLYGKYRQYSFTEHFHSVVAFGVVEFGAMRTMHRGRTRIAPTNTVIFFNPGEVHAPQPAGAEGWSFRMFYPDDEVLRKVSMDMLGLETTFTFDTSFVDNQSLAARLGRLHRLCETYDPTLESESLLASCLAEVAGYTSRPLKVDIADVGHVRIEMAREYLHAHAHERVTLKSLAAAVGLSPFHLLRTFHRQIGLTPHAYLTQARVERARALLRSGISLVDAAFQAGFADQSHFTRHFKKVTGVTPGQYLPLARTSRKVAG